MRMYKLVCSLLMLINPFVSIAAGENDTLVLPDPNENYAVKILVPGTYDADQINYDVDTVEWYAVVNNGVTYSIKKATAKHERVKDSITGKDKWIIKGEESLNTVIYFSGITLEERELYEMKLGKKNFNAGDRMEIGYTGKNFLLTVEAWEKIDRKTKKKYLGKYEMYFSPLKKEKNRQLISYHIRVDEQKPEILFMGDMDGDKVPDMILDNSVNGEQKNLVFYLSDSAEKGSFYKAVGVFSYTEPK